MRAVAVLLLAALCAGCGVTDRVKSYLYRGEDNAEPPTPLVEFRARLHVIKLWSGSAGDGTDGQYLKLAPFVAGQHLFIADSDGEVQAMDATNGRTLWSTDVDAKITGGPGFGENNVLVGTGEGQVIALDAQRGRVLWRASVSSEVLSPPLKSGDVVVVRTNDGKVFGMDGSDGKRLWVYDRSVPTLTLRGTSAPVIVGGAVIAGSHGGRLAALDLPTGRLLWETSIAESRGRSELERMVDIASTPVVQGGIIYSATFQGQLAAVQLENGRILWSRDFSSYAGFCADDANIYVTDENSNVWKIDRFTGTSAWKQEKLRARAATGPACIGDYVVVGDLEGYLHWISKDDGDFVARTRLSDKRIIVPPAVAGRVLYAYSTDGTLAAYTYR